MSATRTPVDDADDRHPNLENPACTRKRVFDILSQSLSQTGRKKKHKKDDVLLPYVRAGRWIPRAFSPFLNITSMFWIGMSATGNNDEESENTFMSQFSPKERNHLAKIHNSVLDMVPGFRDQMSNFSADPEALDHIIDVMTDASKGARSDDTGGLKMKVILYIPRNPKTDACIPPITNNKSKSDRGFNHPLTSRLLCPQKLIREYDADSDIMRARLLDGSIKVVADDWPNFLYDEDMYDPNELDKGLLRGYFLLRVYRHLFTSPSSALKDTPGSHATRSGNAKLHNMVKVTPATIAYAAVQARFALSTVEVWGPEDTHFDLEHFHSAIIELFDPDPTDLVDNEWADETLAWWDRAVFGTTTTPSETPMAIHDTPTDQLHDRALLLAQRAARRARRPNP